jgi:leucyl/phenylalanyl-tRNA--protein transferase
MPVYRLDERLLFPPPERGPRRGPIAVGGDLRPERLLLAYSMGIFPWQGEPLHWHSPDPRLVLLADELHVTRSLRKAEKKAPYRLTLDTAFVEVMTACASVPRPGQDGTWITKAMIESYGELHRRGVAHSVEAWSGDRLVGGLYGLSLGAAFFGESMFALEQDASKLAFVALVRSSAAGASRSSTARSTRPTSRTSARASGRGATSSRRCRARSIGQTRLGPWRFESE